MEYFEPTEVDSGECQHRSTRVRWHAIGDFKFQAKTCLNCEAHGWTDALERKYDKFLSQKNLTVVFSLPASVHQFLTAQGVTTGQALDYFLELVEEDDDLLDWIDDTYKRLFRQYGFSSRADGVSLSIDLSKEQYKRIACLATESGKTIQAMIGDVVGRTVSTAMYLSRDPCFLVHRHGFGLLSSPT